MPRPTSAELVDPIAFPADLGTALWRERRTYPLGALVGVPAAVLVILAFAVAPWPARALCALGAAAILAAAWLRRDRALIETYTVTASYVAIEQPRGGRVAVPLDTLTGVTVEGDHVRLEGTAGVLVLGFVRRRKALIRALETARPALPVGTRLDAFCRT